LALLNLCRPPLSFTFVEVSPFSQKRSDKDGGQRWSTKTTEERRFPSLGEPLKPRRLREFVVFRRSTFNLQLSTCSLQPILTSPPLPFWPVLSVIVTRPGICYSYLSEPPDETGTVGSMYGYRIIVAWVGCKGLPRGPSGRVRD